MTPLLTFFNSFLSYLAMPAKPLKVVMIRRGKGKLSNVSSQNLVTFIRRKVLLGTDELSGDGKSWIRVDRHYQLRKYFADNEKGVPPIGLSGESKSVDSMEFGGLNPPPGLKDDLEKMAGLLRDING